MSKNLLAPAFNGGGLPDQVPLRRRQQCRVPRRATQAHSLVLAHLGSELPRASVLVPEYGLSGLRQRLLQRVALGLLVECVLSSRRPLPRRLVLERREQSSLSSNRQLQLQQQVALVLPAECGLSSRWPLPARHRLQRAPSRRCCFSLSAKAMIKGSCIMSTPDRNPP